MMTRLTDLPFFVLLMGAGALAMLVPAGHAWVMSDFHVMRIFFYGGILFGMLTVLIGIATNGYAPPNIARSQLVALLAAFSVLPLMFAVPFYEAVRDTTYLDAWFEMVSSFTTTGATTYDNAGRLTPSLHLWRALVGWLGGLLIWITAVSIFAPMNLGGFEVRAATDVGKGVGGSYAQIARIADPSERLTRYSAKLAPLYAALTLLLWLGLMAAGEYPYIALCHAMAVLSTSGISPIGGLYYAAAGFWGELLVFGFFVLALSHLVFSPGLTGEAPRRLREDPEVQTAVVLIAVSTMLLFLRHFTGPQDLAQTDLLQALRAFWGGLFTVTSFLTTTGFESHDWIDTAAWSGLSSPGILLLGLALIGGGVATTAGGVKLLRVYALFRHSEREVERLVHPSSVGGGGREARRIRKQGAYISWIFFMLFAMSIAVVMLLLALTGMQFETTMVLAISALSTTGPLAEVAAEYPILYSGVPDFGKIVLAAAMVLGRLETLAIIALFNPDFWRK